MCNLKCAVNSQKKLKSFPKGVGGKDGTGQSKIKRRDIFDKRRGTGKDA